MIAVFENVELCIIKQGEHLYRYCNCEVSEYSEYFAIIEHFGDSGKDGLYMFMKHSIDYISIIRKGERSYERHSF